MFKLQSSPLPHQQSLSLLSRLPAHSQILYMSFSIQSGCLTAVTLGQDNAMTIRQYSLESTFELTTQGEKEGLSGRKIDYVFVEGGDGFLVYRDPFAIYFVTKAEPVPIKLHFKEDLHLETAVMELAYPSLVIFGRKAGELKSSVMELNLDTLHIKVINDGSGYSPGPRQEELSLIADGRVYVFGGRDKKGTPCQQMIYVYDIEKGYWFALQMSYPQTINFSSCQTVTLSSSRVLIISGETQQAWILEIHQSKLTEVSGWVEPEGRLLCVKGQLVAYQGKGWRCWGKEIGK